MELTYEITTHKLNDYVINVYYGENPKYRFYPFDMKRDTFGYVKFLTKTDPKLKEIIGIIRDELIDKGLLDG